MSSSYESGLHVNHSCNDQGTNRTVIDGIDGDSHDEESMFEQASNETVLQSQNVTNRVVRADNILFDYDGNLSEKKDQLQLIRDTRSKHKKDSIARKIMQCRKWPYFEFLSFKSTN